MELVLPILLGAPSVVLAVVLLVLEFRNGLRYGDGTTDVGCMPGPCGCFLVVLGTLLGSSLLPLRLFPWPAVVAFPVGLFVLHSINWRMGRAIGSSRALSLRQARSTDPDARRHALDRLSARADAAVDKPVRQAILDGLADENWEVFHPAALGAHRLGATALVLEALRRRLLNEETAGHDRDVFHAIGPAASEMLLDLLSRGDGSPRAHETAIEALARRADPRAIPHIHRLLSSPQPSVRATAAWAAGMCPDPSLADPLRAALRDSDPTVVNGAVRALVAHGPCFEVVSPLLDPRTVQSGIIESVALLKDSRAIPLLVPLLRHDLCHVRAAAAKSLADLGWRPETPEDRAFDAMARSEWNEVLKHPGSATTPLLLAARDSGVGQTIVTTLEKLLRSSASRLSPEDLSRLAALSGVEQANYKDMGYHEPVSAETVNRLAREELARRS